MECLQSLANYLTFNGVKNLESWAEDGDLIFSPTSAEEGFETRYTANLEASAIEMEPKRLFMLVVSWIHRFNLEREDQNLPNPQFFSERLDGKKYDLGLKIEFIELFKLQANPIGEWLVNGETMSVVSQFNESINPNDYAELKLVDSHTQDNSLTN